MSLILLLPIIVSGFIYCNARYTQFIKLHRYEGQHLYLKSIKYGLVIVVFSAFSLAVFSELASSASLSVHGFIRSYMNHVIGSQSEKAIDDASYYIKLTLISIIFAYGSAFGFNFINIIVKTGFPLPSFSGKVDRKLVPYMHEWWLTILDHWSSTKILLSCDILSDSPLDKILIDAYTNVQEVLISTDSGKVYVGFITQLAEPNERKGMNQEIAVVPTVSGYRDSLDQTVKFTTYYPDDDNDSYVIIKQDLIISASLFNKDTYDQVSKLKK